VRSRSTCQRIAGSPSSSQSITVISRTLTRTRPELRRGHHGEWNEFTYFLVATQDPDLATLNLGIARLTSGSLGKGQQFPLKLALATLSILPITVVYMFASRRFTRSIASTGIK
jgi:hypothetical protein